jgi:hypothetical protein
MANILSDLGVPGREPSAGEKIVAPLETFYGTIGAIHPVQRMVVTFALVSAVEFMLEPSFAFRRDGSTKPSSLLSSDRDATVLHWTTLPILLGVASAVFV